MERRGFIKRIAGMFAGGSIAKAGIIAAPKTGVRALNVNDGYVSAEAVRMAWKKAVELHERNFDYLRDFYADPHLMRHATESRITPTAKSG